MGKKETLVLRNVIRRLRGENASPEVAAALTRVPKLYLETWVIPALEILIADGDLDLAVDLTRLPAPKRGG